MASTLRAPIEDGRADSFRTNQSESHPLRHLIESDEESLGTVPISREPRWHVGVLRPSMASSLWAAVIFANSQALTA